MKKTVPAKFIGEDLFIEFGPKAEFVDFCWACGNNDRQKVGEDQYSLVSTDMTDAGEWPRIYLCPQHFSDLAEQILIHLVRVGKEREDGAIRLPLLKVALYKLPEKEKEKVA